MSDITQYVTDAFETLTPDLNSIYSDAVTYSMADWKALQKSLVTLSGGTATLIPGLHLVGMAADVVFLMNRMSVASYGIGAIIGHQHNYGNILEPEDFTVILGRWCGDENLKNAAISKASAELAVKIGTKSGGKLLSKELAKVACKHAGILIGQKVGGKVGATGAKLGAKLGAKVGAKFGSKMTAKGIGGFIPFLGAGIGAGVNFFFINQIHREAESWFQFKVSV